MEPSSGTESKAVVEQNEKGPERSYSGNGELEFDPTKDLNLPDSYDEVLKRFNRLQGDRAMEAFN